MQYQSESDFSKTLCRRLVALGLKVDRIETGTTRVGVPDIHWTGFGEEGWIEVKNIKKNWVGRCIIPWRPGQQAWALEYYRKKKKPSLTIAAFHNCIIIIPMIKHFENNEVTFKDVSETLTRIGELEL